MCEVTKSSFENLFPLIEKTIKEADFIAIDSEFTGLRVRDCEKPSLFDTVEERYRKLRSSITRLSLCQIGISAFVRDKEKQSFQAHSFNFPLCPMAFGPIDPGFYWQVSAMEFLSRFNFDFNTCMYEGVSFLNDEQEKQLCRSMDYGGRFGGLENRVIDESFIQSLCSKVAEWYVSSKEGQTFTLHRTNTFAKLWNEYVIHTEIRRRFPDVWTTTDSFRNIAVEKVSAERRRELEKKDAADKEKEPEKLKQTMLGFTRVFRVMREYQKPLVGHNMLMDLMFMYDKFFRPLPAKMSSFKRDIHDIFPKIFDTRHFSFPFRKMLQELTGSFSTNLIQLYQVISSHPVTICTPDMPTVTHAKGFERYKSQDTPHEAGFDAYLCGFVFIRLCHMERFKKNKNAMVGYCPMQMYLQSAAFFCNCVNMIRGTVSHIHLEGKDPASKRPQQLFVRCRKRGQKLNMQQLAEMMSSYGGVDICLLSPVTAMVAADNHLSARAILSAFKNDEKITVSQYRFWKHSSSARILMWCGLAVSTGVCVWTVVSLVKDHC